MAYWRFRPGPAPVQLYTFQRLTSDTASNLSPAISPDGKLIAYSSDRAKSGAADIWVQQIEGGQAVRLTTGLGLCHSPMFSPDGSRIVFHGGPDAQGVYVCATFGGEPRRVADGRNPQFSPDGGQIAYMGTSNETILLVTATGGTPRAVPLKHGLVSSPRWLPDGKRLLYLGAPGGAGRGSQWYIVNIDNAEEKPGDPDGFLRDGFAGVPPQSLSADGILVASGQTESNNIYRVPFDMEKGRVTGAPVPVTMAPGLNFWPASSADGSKIAFGSAASFNTNVWTMNLDPDGVATGEPRRITDGLVDHMSPSPAADGKLLAYKAVSTRTQEIRVLNLATGQDLKIAEARDTTSPVMSPDSAQLAYSVRDKDGLSVFAVPVTGGVPRRLCAACGRPVAWIENGSKLLYDQAANNTEIGVWMPPAEKRHRSCARPMHGSTRHAFLRTDEYFRSPV